MKKWAYWKLAEALNLSSARAVLFTCEQERDLARASFSPYKVNERVTGLGTSAPTVDIHNEAKQFLNNNRTLQAKPFLLFLGRLHTKKGLDLLINAFIQSQRNGIAQDYQLAIVGPCADSNYYQSLKDLAKPSKGIHFIDMLKGNRKWLAQNANRRSSG